VDLGLQNLAEVHIPGNRIVSKMMRLLLPFM
jgi:hypothetical protein